MTDSRFDDLQDLEDKTSDEKLSGFVMCYTDQMRAMLSRLKARDLKPRDLAVLFALLGFYNPKTGLCHVTVKYLSEVVGANLTDVSGSIGRLKKSLMVATYVDKVSGQRSLFLNPFMFVSGGGPKRAFLQTRFMSLINE